MSKFNSKVFTTRDGIEVHFITRKRGKPVSEEEMMEYIREAGLVMAPVGEDKNWKPASNKLFLTELRSGLAWCANKYGVSELTIESFVRDRLPHINTSYYRSKTDG